MDRLALNAMVERLVESRGEDAEAREALAAFTVQIKRSSPWRFYSQMSTPGEKISGQTNLGTVEVDDDRTTERSISLGTREERIGHYKLIRQGSELDITHFWKSDVSTQSETEIAQSWRLCLDDANKPVWFGEKAIKHLFTLPLAGRYFRVIVNREMFVKRWGTEGPEVRPGAWAIQVEITNV